MFQAVTRVCSVAVLALISFHSAANAAVGRQSNTATDSWRAGTPASSRGPASAAHSPQRVRKTVVSWTTPHASATSAPAIKNFPGVQNADILLPGHAVSNSAWTYASLTVDLNGDGYPDVVTAQIDGTLNASLNPGPSGGAWQLVTNKSAYDPNSVYYQGGIDYVYTADLNGDKLPDVVTLNYNTRKLYVYLNRGGGSFGKAVAYKLPFEFAELDGLPATGGLAIGDMDGDGFPDIVALGMQWFTPDSSSSSVQTLTMLNRRDGTFGTASASEISVLPGSITSTYAAVKLADINGDGIQDLVFVGSADSALFVAVTPGTSDHVFHNPLSSLPYSQIQGSYIVALGSTLLLQDIDGDGVADALFQQNSDVYLAKGHAGGSFDAPVSVLSSLGAGRTASFADMNGDGLLDVVVYLNAVTSIYNGTGKGQFSKTPIQIPGGSRSTMGWSDRQVPEPADIDGDGKLDLLGLDTDTGEVGIFLNSANGFHTPQVVVPDPKVYGGMFSAGVAAIQAPGSLDLVTIMDVLGNPPDGSISPPVLAISNDGAGNYLPGAYHTLLTSDQTSSVTGLLSSNEVAAIVDINGDGLADLVLTSGVPLSAAYGGGLSVSYNKGDYTFSDPEPLTNLDFGFSCSLERTAVGDLNHDGKPDFVTAYRGNNCNNAYSNPGLPAGFLTYLSKPDGTYVSGFFGYGTHPYIPVLADINGDGNLDLVLAETSYGTQPPSGITVLPGKPDGSFDQGAAATILPSTSLVSSVVAGDFDGDGKQDLAIGVLYQLDSSGNPEDNTTGLLIMKGNSNFTFNKGAWYLPGSQVWAARVADFDGDGLPDLALNVTTAAANGYSSATDGAIPEPGLVLLPNLGAGIFGTPQPVFGSTSVIGGSYQSPPVDGSLQVADFNGDGALDVLNDNAYEPNIYLNVGAVKFSITTSASTIVQDSSVTITAALQPTVSQKTPGGTVSFFANGTLLGTTPVQAGQASFGAANLAPGDYSISAQYSGDSSFNAASAATSVAVNVSTLTPDFSLAAPTPTSLSLVAGQAGTVTLTLTGNATFSGAVTLGCTGATTGMQCLLSPASVSLAPGQTATVTVAAATRGSDTATALNSAPIWKGLTSGLSVASVFLLGLGARKRKALSAWCALLVLGGFALMGVTGCGSSSHKTLPDNSTPAGTYSLRITATAGSSTHSQTVPVTVTAAR